MGGAFIFVVFIAFLGPEFVTGMCRDVAPNAAQVWVVRWRALECVKFAMNVTVNGSTASGP